MRKLLLLMLIFMGLNTYAQTRHAYLPEGVTSFQTSSERIVIGFRQGRAPGEKMMTRLYGWLEDTAIRSTVGFNKWNIFKLDSLHKNADSLKYMLSVLRADTTVAYANPILIYKTGVLQALTDQVIVRTKGASDSAQIASLYDRLGVYAVKPNPYTDREYLLTIHPTPKMDALDVADSLYNTGLFEYSEPDFLILNAMSTTDPLYSHQWNLANTGQYNGTAGDDIKAPAAWCTATGTGIKIAIVDEGVDLVHADLSANILPGYVALGQGTNGAPINNDAHGTACAGLASAVANNGIGIAGVAPTSKIISVRVAAGNVVNYSAAATGIGWASSATGGNADILSMSFDGGSTSSALNNAIASAISSGRGGKGCVVLISSGDIETGTIQYPANLPNVIAVGGTDACDQRFTTSSSTPSTSCQ